MLRVDPDMLPCLDELEADLLNRRVRAAAERWLGELEGLDLTLRFLRERAAEARRLNRGLLIWHSTELRRAVMTVTEAVGRLRQARSRIRARLGSGVSLPSARSIQALIKLFERDRSRCGAVLDQLPAQMLQQRIYRGGHVVQPAEEHHLAIDVVGLDAAGLSGEALPRRATSSCPAGDRMELQQVSAPSPVLSDGCGVDARGGQAFLALNRSALADRSASRRRPTHGLDSVAEIGHQLAPPPARQVSDRPGVEASFNEGYGDCSRGVVDTSRKPPHVEDSRNRGRERLNNAWFQVRRRAGDGDAIDMGEPTQRLELVAHSVLQAHNRQMRRGDAGQVGEHPLAVLALHRNQAYLITPPVHGPGMVHRGDLQSVLTGRILQEQPLRADRVQMPATCDQHYAVAMLKQPGSHHTADAACAVDDESHQASLPPRSPRYIYRAATTSAA
jgi:hypothetical protein